MARGGGWLRSEFRHFSPFKQAIPACNYLVGYKLCTLFLSLHRLARRTRLSQTEVTMRIAQPSHLRVCPYLGGLSNPGSFADPSPSPATVGPSPKRSFTGVMFPLAWSFRSSPVAPATAALGSVLIFGSAPDPLLEIHLVPPPEPA